ncbi:DUF5106 domain-containing protein, partial [Dysgonomonas termitidis]
MIFCFQAFGEDDKPAAVEAQASPPGDAPRRFIPPVIPVELSRPAERAGYLIAHYWDNFDFSDTA